MDEAKCQSCANFNPPGIPKECLMCDEGSNWKAKDEAAATKQSIEKWEINWNGRTVSNPRIIPLIARPYSMHPDDWYLSVVMCQVTFGVHPYMVSLYNSQGSFYFEDRFFKDKQEAYDFWKVKH